MNEQGDFDFEEWHGDEQAENLERVSSRIAMAVLDFCRDHRRFFFMEELRGYIIRATGVAAPDSSQAASCAI